METNKTYRWECPRGHRHNNVGRWAEGPEPTNDRPAACCPSCGWYPPDDGGQWLDLSSGCHWDPDFRYVTKAEG